METKTLIMMGAVVIIGYTISLLYSKFVKKKALDLSTAENAAKDLKQEDIEVLFNSDFAKCAEHLDGKKILAANYLYHIPTAKDQFKTGAKDVLKSILTLGTVKFTTVQVPVPVVLTEDGLHLFQLDADEKVKGHFLFDNERLSHAKLTKAPQTKIPEELGNSAKFYTLSIPTDGDTKELSLCTILYPTQQTFLGYSQYRRLLAFATGQHFFKTLGAKFAQLNVL